MQRLELDLLLIAWERYQIDSTVLWQVVAWYPRIIHEKIPYILHNNLINAFTNPSTAVLKMTHLETRHNVSKNIKLAWMFREYQNGLNNHESNR